MMKTLSIIVLSFLVSLRVSSQQREDKCMSCHEVIGDNVAEMYKQDVHAHKGISCSGCHGGDPHMEEMEQAMAVEKGYIGVPKGDDISTVCAKCHSNAAIMVKEYNSILSRNQLEILQLSVHGKLSVSGKERIVQCTTCHGVHGIVSVKSPSSPVFPTHVPKTCAKCHSDAIFMRAYNPALPVDQLEKYHTSVHGMLNAKGDHKPAECVSCHGSHDIRSAKDAKSAVYPTNLPATCAKCHSNARYMKEYKIPSDQFKKYSVSVHGKALLEKGDIGAPACNDCHGNHAAVPPGTESISQVCGTCHSLNASLFASSPHKKAFDQKKLPECETCHGYHEIVSATDELLGVSPDAVCSRCHKENQNQKGFIVAKKMRELIDSLESSDRIATLLVSDAEQKGMEVSEARFKLRDVRQARLQSRTLVHSFNLEKFHEVLSNGLTITGVVKSQGQAAIDEYYFRRWGLGIATLIITVVAVSLYVTIRRIEKRQTRQE
ncbi:MAG: ammonia-forming cytochrome c nitrite reductase subunit c552 [Ignavibacteriae bacterium]|nr:ammonia-forming cytochrome c nitrite reductase subunit c552 [Ignavibacteriota bacterium]